MERKKAAASVGVFLLISVLLVGYGAVAAETGGKDDPIVTLSYLGGLNPDYEKTIEKIVDEKTDPRMGDMENRLSQVSQDILELQTSGGADLSELSDNPDFIAAVAAAISQNMETPSAPSGSGDVFQKVEIEAGKTVELEMGSMLLLRVGEAVCVAPSDPGLIDMTDGTTLSSGGTILQNHLYTVTIASGRGFKTNSAVTVFIMGQYNLQ